MPPKRIASGPRSYHDLAWTWPNVSPPEDYVEEAEEHWVALERHARVPLRTLLHLGCGGGHLDRTLKVHARVTGVDVSEAMLTLARALNPGVDYQKGDMRTVRLPRRFDAVLIADSIAYMCTEADLLAAFRTAFVHLRPGGAFLTYVEQIPETFREGHTTSTVHSGEGIEITFIENLHDPDPRDTTYESRFLYLIRERGRVRIERDVHTCGMFPVATWERLLRDAGFEVERIDGRLGGSEDRPVATFVGLRPTSPRRADSARRTKGLRPFRDARRGKAPARSTRVEGPTHTSASCTVDRRTVYGVPHGGRPDTVPSVRDAGPLAAHRDSVPEHEGDCGQLKPPGGQSRSSRRVFHAVRLSGTKGLCPAHRVWKEKGFSRAERVASP